MFYCQLCSTRYSTFFESRTVQKAPLQSTHTEKNGAAHPSYINYHLKCEVSIKLHCRLCSTRYPAVRIKNCLKSTSAIKTTTIKNMDDFLHEGNSFMKGSHYVLSPNQHFLLLEKMNGTQRRTLVSP